MACSSWWNEAWVRLARWRQLIAIVELYLLLLRPDRRSQRLSSEHYCRCRFKWTLLLGRPLDDLHFKTTQTKYKLKSVPLATLLDSPSTWGRLFCLSNKINSPAHVVSLKARQNWHCNCWNYFNALLTCLSERTFTPCNNHKGDKCQIGSEAAHQKFASHLFAWGSLLWRSSSSSCSSCWRCQFGSAPTITYWAFGGLLGIVEIVSRAADCCWCNSP